MAHPDMRTKKQVTARITDQFAKDLNLVMACTGSTSATDVVQHAVHQLAEYYRYVMQRKVDDPQVVQSEAHEPGKATLCRACEDDGHSICM